MRNTLAPNLSRKTCIRLAESLLKFFLLRGTYAVVRLAPKAPIPDWATRGDFTAVTRTADELSIVCSANNIPKEIAPDQFWICVKLEGPFPFTQTGVLLSLIEPLSKNGIPIFAISTYDTDYVLIPQEQTDQAVDLLRKAGHELASE